ncbi:hypothetical protein [Catenuloplanes japonicus]|uniref:hypothetical protein n=1 Tax=Catenuloplanes japonicus TaxID=33876 RepID=UPI0012FC69EE|nr:hypothetical protein [Catenuloplanes japonicus]
MAMLLHSPLGPRLAGPGVDVRAYIGWRQVEPLRPLPIVDVRAAAAGGLDPHRRPRTSPSRGAGVLLPPQQRDDRADAHIRSVRPVVRISDLAIGDPVLQHRVHANLGTLVAYPVAMVPSGLRRWRQGTSAWTAVPGRAAILYPDGPVMPGCRANSGAQTILDRVMSVDRAIRSP